MDGIEVDPAGSFLVDATDIPLDQLISIEDSAFARAVSRLVAEIEEPREVIAAFDNYAGEDGPAPALAPKG